jgi:hypothetical protein
MNPRYINGSEGFRLIKYEKENYMNPFSMPPALLTLTEKLKYSYNGPERIGRFDTFFVDLADLKLSLTDYTPCIWVKAEDLHTLSPVELSQHLQDIARQKSWNNEKILVFIDGEAPLLREYLPKYLPAFILFNQADQQNITQANAPTVILLEILGRQVSRAALSPYEVHLPVAGNRFFGRQQEINKVLQHPQSSYLFLGIRRIGKTSLLMELQRLMDKLDPPGDGQRRRIYIDCSVITSEEEFFRALISEVDPSGMKFYMGRPEHSKRYQRTMFNQFVSIHGTPMTFLVDEIDRLLASLEDENSLFDVLRSAAASGKVRFIMAGFRRPMHLYGSETSAFYHFADKVRLGKMQRNDIKDMVVIPMESLGVSFKNREGVVSRILRETGGLPNYVQFYCQTLLEQLDETEKDEISEDDLGSVYENREFRDFVLEAFMTNTERVEQAMVYALISEDPEQLRHSSWSERAIDGVMKKRRLSLNLEQLERVCKNLEIGGVLNQVGKDYEFAVPLLQRTLCEARDVNFLFDKMREEILKEKLLS